MSEEDKERNRQLVEILLAEANGEKIEGSSGKTHWYDLDYDVMREVTDDHQAWFGNRLFFRVKPKPKVIAFCLNHGYCQIDTVFNCGSCGFPLFKFYREDQIKEGQ